MLNNQYGFTDKDYGGYANKPSRVQNEKLRPDGQTFSQAMREGSIVAGLNKEVGERVLEAITKAGDVNAC